MLSCNASFPPFRCRSAVAVSPLPFRCAVVPCRCTAAVLPFRSYRCRCRWERKCWNWKRLSVHIGMKWPERWLVVHQRQNGNGMVEARHNRDVDHQRRNIAYLGGRSQSASDTTPQWLGWRRLWAVFSNRLTAESKIESKRLFIKTKNTQF